MTQSTYLDVAIVGGGPGGATVGALLKKYRPSLKVAIFERERFPRDHVGESLLPPVCHVLDEMGCWDKVEGAGFPVKIGATYRWGKVPELWHFNFIPPELFKDLPRPGQFSAHRQYTAFQVDRGVYDKILLDHAAESGCLVREGTKVERVCSDGDRIESLELANGECVSARYYVDASGASAVIRRSIGVATENPTNLRNIAIWDYWQNAEWAYAIGVGGTRIQILSLPYGWVWFIPLGPTRTSIGLVVPAEFYKTTGKRPEELYLDALAQERIVAGLLENASREGKLQTTRDWSFLSKRLCGENWFLVGDSAGFADPILSAGLSLTQAAGRQLSYTLLELFRSSDNEAWLKAEFETRQIRRIRNHIRFADYWYCANAQLTDLKAFTADLARENGLDLSPESAWAWIAAGGFVQEGGRVGTAGFTLAQVQNLKGFLGDLAAESIFQRYNVFELNLENATSREGAFYEEGHVSKVSCYYRGERILPLQGTCALIVDILKQDTSVSGIVEELRQAAEPLRNTPEQRVQFLHNAVQTLEALVSDGWVKASHNASEPIQDLTFASTSITWDRDPNSFSNPR